MKAEQRYFFTERMANASLVAQTFSGALPKITNGYPWFKTKTENFFRILLIVLGRRSTENAILQNNVYEDEMTDNSNKIILHICADIGSDSIYYQKNGYDVRLIGSKIGVENYSPPDNVYGIIANPPCTMFSFARTNARLPRDLKQGMFCVEHCLRIIWQCQYQAVSKYAKYTRLKFWALENPYFGLLKNFLGKPVLVYSPEEYGDNYQKRTALWGNFNIPIKTSVDLSPEMKAKVKTNSYLHTRKFDSLLNREIHPEKLGVLDRQARRSICSNEFAKAFFEANQ